MLIQAANVAETVRGSERFGVESSLDGIGYASVVEEMDSKLSGIAEAMEQRYRAKDKLTLYKDEARFVDDRTLEVGDNEIRGEKVVAATGTSPLVPPIDEVDYLTSNEVLYLDEAPESLVVVGGGYIACEVGYSFEAMGTKVKIIEANDVLLHREGTEDVWGSDVRACNRVSGVSRGSKGQYLFVTTQLTERREFPDALGGYDGRAVHRLASPLPALRAVSALIFYMYHVVINLCQYMRLYR